MNKVKEVNHGDMNKIKKIIESSKTTTQFELAARFYLSQFVGEEREMLLEIIRLKAFKSFNCKIESGKSLRFIYSKGDSITEQELIEYEL